MTVDIPGPFDNSVNNGDKAIPQFGALECVELHTEEKRGGFQERDSCIPDLLNQLLATVASAARPSTNSWEKSFIFAV